MIDDRYPVDSLRGTELEPRVVDAFENLQQTLTEHRDWIDNLVALREPRTAVWEPRAIGRMFNSAGQWVAPVLGEGRYVCSSGPMHWFEIDLGGEVPAFGSVKVDRIGVSYTATAQYAGQDVGSVSGHAIMTKRFRFINSATDKAVMQEPANAVLHLALVVRPAAEVTGLQVSSVSFVFT